MDEQKAKNRWVHTITGFAQMRFAPEQTYERDVGRGSERLVERIKTMMPWASPEVPLPNGLEGEDRSLAEASLPQLHFARKLTSEHLLIGNQNQLDLISIHSATHSALYTEYLWSISIDGPIDLICVDAKKCLLVLGSKNNKKVSVFRYDSKKIHERPILLKEIITRERPYEVSILRDVLAIFKESKVAFFIITSKEEVIKQQEVPYNFPPGMRLELFQVPQPVDSTLNIFFSQEKPHCSTFVLWMCELEYSGNSCKISEAEKIYDIKNSLKSKIKIRNTNSKGNFIMNLENQILVFKKGYILDSVNINVKLGNSYLKYTSHDTIVHFSEKRLEIYNYECNTAVKPFKIKIRARDSMEIKVPPNAIYFDAISVFNGNILLILQVDPPANRKTKGQFNYWLAITQPILLEAKINQLFPTRKISSLNPSEIEDRIEMASKMGLTNKEIYLELWDRSQKTDRNFPLLLSTRDYDSIHSEVIKMLKKKSMSFAEVYKIERSSAQMLKSFLFSSNCTKRIFFGYISSCYLIKKLEYFRDVALFTRNGAPNQAPLCISIKEYNEIKDMHLINYFVYLCKELCLEGKPLSREIKLYLTAFRLQLRPVYFEVLQQLIDDLGASFITLLQEIPEILPYSPEENVSAQKMQGIWRLFDATEREQTMCLDNISTIDNAEVIRSGIKDLWFRRSHMSVHCFTAETLKTISATFKQLNSEQTFYSIIEMILAKIPKQEDRRNIFAFIETKYASKISHLQDRINLYNSLYSYLSEHSILPLNPQGQAYSFREFLSLRDSRLFFHLFKTEKTRKGLILKEMKPIFDTNSPKDKCLFNDFLLNYFKSPISELSDIKYLLNRINNEHIEFHMESQPMYEVLVEAMTMKLMVGTGHDIPLSEILIYIENIPIKNEYLLNKLTIISAVNRNSKIMQQAGVNMSIMEIIESPKAMMSKIIDYKLKEYGMFHENSPENQHKISYKILVFMEDLHWEIFKSSSSTRYIYFIYLVCLAKEQKMIPHIRRLIDDVHLTKNFFYDESISNKLVVHLYKNKMSGEPEYHKNSEYLRNILTLLPADNDIRKYIICEFEIANMLTTPLYKVKYPLSYNHVTLGMAELEHILSQLTVPDVLSINIEQLALMITAMESLNTSICDVLEDLEDDKSDMESMFIFIREDSSQLTRKQVYELFMLRLLSVKKLREVLPIMEQYFKNPSNLVQSDIVYPMMFLIEMESDLSYECKQLFFRACCVHFKEPGQLFQLVKKYTVTAFSSRDRVRFLRGQVQTSQLGLKGFNIQNKMLNQSLVNIAKIQGLQKNLFTLLLSSFQHLVNSRADFSQNPYSFIYAILINDPHSLAKFILCYPKHNTIRSIRLFLTYLIKEKAFDPLVVLEVGYRTFIIALYCLRDEMQLEVVAHRFSAYPLDTDLPAEEEPDYDHSIEFFNVLARSSAAFKEEKSSLRKKMERENEEKEGENQDRQLDSSEHKKKSKKKTELDYLLNPNILLSQQPIDYSDVEAYENGEEREKMLRKDGKGSKFIEKITGRKISPKRKDKPEKRPPNISLKDIETPEQDKSSLSPNTLRRNILPSFSPGNSEPVNKDLIMEALMDEEAPADTVNVLLPKELDVKDLIKNSSISGEELPKDIMEPESPKRDIERVESLTIELPELEKTPQLRPLVSCPDHPYYAGSDMQPKSEGSIRKARSDISEEEASIKKSANEQKNIVGSDTPAKKGGIGIMYKVEGFPSVKEVGHKIYQQNLLAFESRNPKYKLQGLGELKDKENFQKFVTEVMKYIYSESNESSIDGVIGLFELIIKKYQLPYSIKNLGLWRRSEKLFKAHRKLFKLHHKDLNVREIMPIEMAFRPEATLPELYKQLEEHILASLDDSNIYKLAKIIGKAFLSDQFENQVIYSYLVILAQRVTNQADALSVDQQKQLLAVVIKKVPIQMLCQRFPEYYSRADPNKKKDVMELVVNRVKQQGTKEQKIMLLKEVVAFDQSEAGFLERLRRSQF